MRTDRQVPISGNDHVVHFYDRVDEHLSIVAAHLAEALGTHGAVGVLARPSLCRALETALVCVGVDVEVARAEGRFVTLDAENTLASFMIGSSPDAELFDSVVGDVVRSLSATGRVRMYGEMVGVLWDAGNVAAAIQVEDLWERLATQLSFSLLCGYHNSAPFGAVEVDAFAEVCRRHSTVIGDAPQADGAEASRRFARSTHAPRAARRFVTTTLRSWELDALVDDGSMAVSELATNAVMHANSHFTVGLARTHDGVRLTVSDTSRVAPHVRDDGAASPAGRGLRMLSSLAESWGHVVVDGGKVVWVDLVEHQPDD